MLTTNVSYMIFYILDNFAVLTKIGIFKYNYKKIKRAGYLLWLIGLVSALIYYVIRVKTSFKREADLKTAMLNNMTPHDFCQTIITITEERRNFLLNIIRIVGDLVVAV